MRLSKKEFTEDTDFTRKNSAEKFCSRNLRSEFVDTIKMVTEHSASIENHFKGRRGMIWQGLSIKQQSLFGRKLLGLTRGKAGNIWMGSQ